MEIDARVLEVNNTARRISISIKEVEPIDPEVSAESETAPVEETATVEEAAPVEEAVVVEEAAPVEAAAVQQRC